MQRALFACAVATLGYCAFAFADAWMFQRKESRQLEVNLSNPAMAKAAPSTGLVGRIEIPRLSLSVMVTEGVDSHTLGRAAGHIPGTALPGTPGNIGISAHRDTFFRPLRNIRKNDIIILTTLVGEYRYRVVSTKIVSPRDVEVLDPSKNEILT